MSFGETFNIGGIVASVSNPTVTNVTSASGNEGTSLVHTVTLSAATTTSTNYTYSLSDGTATAGVDYTVPPTFSNGVTLSGSLTVPTAVSSFTVTVAAISDGSSESSETYNLTIGGVTGVGTIIDSSLAGLRWSDPATWGGVLPTSSDAVTIASGQTIILDTAAVAQSVTVAGTLVVDPAVSISLTTQFINIGGSGAFDIGTESAPYPATRTATITLNGTEAARTARTVNGVALGFTNDGVGRSIQVQPGGKLRAVVGQFRNLYRTRLNAHASAGATSLTLADAVDWKAGDEIVVGPTDFYGTSSGQTQKVTLTADAVGTSVSFTPALTTSRWGLMQYVTDAGMSTTPGTLTSPPAGTATTLDERAMVVNITRNVVIQGANDAAWTSNKFGAHMMFMGRTSEIKIDGVQLRRVGQAGAIGRYPIHWHMNSYNMPSGMNAQTDGTFIGAVLNGHYAKNCSISESGQRMAVIHGTHGVTLDKNVGYDITGHAIFLEDGSEQDNVISNNAVLRIRVPTSGNRLFINDTNVPAADFGTFKGKNGTCGIWFSNPKNTLLNNWVADSEGTGIWNTFASQCFGLSLAVALNPSTTPLFNYAGNIAACNLGAGAMTAFRQTDAQGNTQEALHYIGGTMTEKINTLQCWKNSAGGYFNRVQLIQYEGWTMADNEGMFVSGAATDNKSLGINFLMVGESLNNATSRYASSYASAFATYHEFMNFPNAMAVNFQFVDGVLFDDRFVEVGGGLFRMNDLYTRPLYTFGLNTNVRRINTPASFQTRSANIDGNPLQSSLNPAIYRNYSLAGAIYDSEGLFVQAGKYWVPDLPFFTSGATGITQVAPSGLNGVQVDDRFYGVNGFNHTYDSSADYMNNLPLLVQREDVSTGAEIGRWEIGDGNLHSFFGRFRHFAAKQNGRYKITFPGNMANTVCGFIVDAQYDATSKFLVGVHFDGTVPAKVIMRALQWASFTGVNVPVDSYDSYARILTPAADMAAINADTTGTIYWQDTANNYVWFQVVTKGIADNYSYPVDGENNRYRNVQIAVKSTAFP